MLHISCPSNQASEPNVLTVAFSCATLSDTVILIYACSITRLSLFIYPEDATKVSLTMLFL